MYDNLTKDGILAINIPSHTVKRWWANTGNWMGGTPHVHSFKYLRQMLLTIPMRELKDMSLSLI